MSATAWLAVAIFAVAYALIATEKIHRVAAALGGAALMLVIGATDAEHAFFSEDAGIDWNVIFLLLGMMLIVAVLRRTGAFEYVAIWAAKRARGRPYRADGDPGPGHRGRLGGLDNVTTVLLVAPVTFLVCDRLGVPVVPFLIAEAMASNIGGTATLVGDPPNIIIASRAGLSYNDFLAHLAPIVVAAAGRVPGAVPVAVPRRVQLRPGAGGAGDGAARARRDQGPAPAGRQPRRPRRWSRPRSCCTPCCTWSRRWSRSSAGCCCWRLSRLDAGRGRQGRRVADAGVLRRPVRHGRRAGQHRRHRRSCPRPPPTRSRAGCCGATMAAAVGLGRAVGDRGQHPVRGDDEPDRRRPGAARRRRPGRNVLWWSLALGADLGGNATAIGASANVVMLGMAERAGRPISFWEFTKYGLVVTVITVALCVPYLWLRYFVFA